MYGEYIEIDRAANPMGNGDAGPDGDGTGRCTEGNIFHYCMYSALHLPVQKYCIYPLWQISHEIEIERLRNGLVQSQSERKAIPL